jgi:hypothetical protein
VNGGEFSPTPSCVWVVCLYICPFVAGCQRGAAFIGSGAGHGRSCNGLESVAPLTRATIF